MAIMEKDALTIYKDENGDKTIVYPITRKENVDGLDEIEQSASNAQAGLAAVRARMCNPNLLDNWYFVGGGSQQGGGRFPINQRGGYYVVPPGVPYSLPNDSAIAGTTDNYYPVSRMLDSTFPIIVVNGVEYTAAANSQFLGYIGRGITIDRWKQPNDGVVRIHDDYISVLDSEWGYNQVIELLPAGTYTVSCLIRKLVTPRGRIVLSLAEQDAAIIPTASEASGDDFVLYSGTVTLSGDVTNAVFAFWHNANYGRCSFELKAVKLELGETQTLAHQENGAWVLNDIPDYGTELARCQRYYYDPWEGLTDAAKNRTIHFLAVSDQSLMVNMTLPVTMRSQPELIITSDRVRNQNKGEIITPDMSALQYNVSKSYVGNVYNFPSGTLSAGDPYSLRFVLSADL